MEGAVARLGTGVSVAVGWAVRKRVMTSSFWNVDRLGRGDDTSEKRGNGGCYERSEGTQRGAIAC